jgi:hypothetical protein
VAGRDAPWPAPTFAARRSHRRPRADTGLRLRRTGENPRTSTSSGAIAIPKLPVYGGMASQSDGHGGVRTRSLQPGKQARVRRRRRRLPFVRSRSDEGACELYCFAGEQRSDERCAWLLPVLGVGRGSRPLAGCSRRVDRLRRGCREHLRDHARAVFDDFRGQCSCWAVLDRWAQVRGGSSATRGQVAIWSRRRSAARSRGLARRSSRRSAVGGRRRALVEDRRAERLYRLVERRDDL